MTALELALSVFVVVAAVLAAVFRDIVGAVAMFAAFSLGIAIVWLLLSAPDVALTEAAVGAGVMAMLLLVALMKTSRDPLESETDRPGSLRSIDVPAAVVTAAVALPLAYSVSFFPSIGDPGAPAVSAVDRVGDATPYAHYVGAEGVDHGLTNAVAAVLVIYRGLDTLGEVIVAFTAVIGVLVVLGRERASTRPRVGVRARSSNDDTTVAFPDPYVMSPVVTTAIRTVVPLVFAFGAYLTLHGTYLPGGGFQGGVVMGSAFVLLGLAFGLAPTSDWIDERALVAALVLGVGAFVGVAVAALAFRGTLLEVLAYPIAPAITVEVVEVGIGVLVGGVVTALVVAMAVGVRNGPTDGGGSS